MEFKLQEDLNPIKTWSSQYFFLNETKISLMKMLKRMGEITDPCGSPILVWNLERFHILDAEQEGFRHFRSTVKALLSLTQDMFRD
jgi:hypothetical protein